MAEVATDSETLNPAPAQDMELDNSNTVVEEATADAAITNGDDTNSKREREETESGEENGGLKKQKVEKSAEEERLEKLEETEGEKVESVPVKLGPKSFETSVQMFDYFYKFLHSWSPNINVNKYEHLVLLDLLNKGHLEPEKKIGKGVKAFQVRFHPQYESRCFFIVRTDESVDDFSFRKCVDHILPLPENMQVKSEFNKRPGGGGRGRGGGRGGYRGGRGRGGGGRFRN